MTFNKHYIGVIIRIALLVIASWAAVFLIVVKGLYLSAALLLLVVLIQIIELLRLIRRTNRELTRLFDSIRNNDFSLHFTEKAEGSGFKELHTSFNTLIESYKKVKLQKEQHYQQLAQVIEFLNSGIISFDEDGDIHLMNSAAADMLGIPVLKKWSMVEDRFPEWTRIIDELPFHEQRSVELNQGGKEFLHLVYKGKIKLGKSEHIIISFQGIKDEVERQEIQAYHKLIRILTHEIMNSVTPISSLSDTLSGLLRMPENDQLKLSSEMDDETLRDLNRGLQTISQRSNGLLRFVEDYRKLTRVPKPMIQEIKLSNWWAEQKPILLELLQGSEIALTFEANTRNKSAFFDRNLIEQVLINLVMNACEATRFQSDAQITLGISAHGDIWNLYVEDNGPGIPEEKRSEIFIPFFSTKVDGSGIGLSLSRSIVQSHRGKLYLLQGERQTRFEVSLPTKPRL